ncbi:MAG: acetyl-CoA carboxylase biotin carboxylase subunit [Hyphomicrobiaceae bacterium]
MFDKILIANRGEIACRIMKTARRMEIATVAVYSDADRDSLHVEMANEAVRIGPPQATESYLRVDRIIAACRTSGAQAVHPGYGFLSERDAFAQALADEGIVFIGPNPAAIAAMGDKIESKKAAAAAEVSTVPGVLGEIGSPQEAIRIARDIGYPVIIKASAGGGGKGMRIAASDAEVEEGFTLAKSEALSSFGDDRVFIEKFIINPRHIEIQILGDKHGNVIHLGERECSIQRRNQKVIEEAPSPLLDEQSRALMGAQAVALARAVNYDSAGTVEFVAGQDRSFYFLEMNTRLQVEHPVTEMITGIDLVEQMIRIAAGEELSLHQSDIRANGWSVESRIYAEDPYRNFLPSIGRLAIYRPPAEGIVNCASVRNDTGVVEGDDISMFYDPMIAKLVTHAPTRSAAIEAQSQALDAFYIDGIQHNIPFVSAIMQHPRWKAGELSTGFIAEAYPDGFKRQTPEGEVIATLAAVAAAIDHLSNVRRREISDQMEGPSINFSVDRVVKLGRLTQRVSVAGGFGEPTVVTLCDDNDVPHSSLDVSTEWWPGQPVWSGTVRGQAVNVQVRPILNGYDLAYRGVSIATHVFTPREAMLASLMPERQATDTSRFLLCPMPGLVKDILVKEDQDVKAGDALAVVEAMKMENVLRAERDARVINVRAKPGDSLAVDAVILEFDALKE